MASRSSPFGSVNVRKVLMICSMMSYISATVGVSEIAISIVSHQYP